MIRMFSLEAGIHAILAAGIPNETVANDYKTTLETQANAAMATVLANWPAIMGFLNDNAGDATVDEFISTINEVTPRMWFNNNYNGTANFIFNSTNDTALKAIAEPMIKAGYPDVNTIY